MFANRGVPKMPAVSTIKKTVVDDLLSGEKIFKAFACDQVKAIDSEKRLIDFIISTDRVDRYGDSIAVSGWDLKEYKRNPVVLFGHASRVPPVGRAVKVWKDADTLRATAEFMPPDISEFAYSIFRMYEGGYLRSVSVGFIPLKWEKLTDDSGMMTGFKFLKQELLEFSCVPIPANPDALVDAKKKGINLDPINEWYGKLLDNWDAEAAVVTNLYGVDRKGIEEMKQKASGSGKSIVVPPGVQDLLLAANLKKIHQVDKVEEGASVSDDVHYPAVGVDVANSAGNVTFKSVEVSQTLEEDNEDGSKEKSITVSHLVVDFSKVAKFSKALVLDKNSPSISHSMENDTITVKASNGELTYKVLGEVAGEEAFCGELLSFKDKTGRNCGGIPYGMAHPQGTAKKAEAEQWLEGSEIVAKCASVEDLMVMCAWKADKPASDLTVEDFKLPHHTCGGDYAVVWKGLVKATASLPKIGASESEMFIAQQHLDKHYKEFGKEGPWDKSASEWLRYLQSAASGRTSSCRGMCKSLFGDDLVPEEVWPLTEEEKAALAEEVVTLPENKDKEQPSVVTQSLDVKVAPVVTDDEQQETGKPEQQKGAADKDDKDCSDISIEEVCSKAEEFISQLEDELVKFIKSLAPPSRKEIRKLRFIRGCLFDVLKTLGEVIGEESPEDIGEDDEPTKKQARQSLTFDQVDRFLESPLVLEKIKLAVSRAIEKERGRLPNA
jgi:HK97 family phage prohead protease